MKIFFLVRSLHYGGAERQLILLSKGLQERGHDVVIGIFYSGGPLEKELWNGQIRVRRLDKQGRWDVFGFLVRLIQVVREERPDVLHGYLFDPNLLTVVLKPFFPNLKIVWGVRSSVRDARQEDWLDRLSFHLNCWLSRFPDVIITNSNVGLEYHLARGYPREKMVVIPNGVDTERFYPDTDARNRIRSEWGVTDDLHVVGLVARLDPIKDHPNFLKAAALLAKQRKDVRFVCVGYGSQEHRRTLQLLAEELGLREFLIWNEAREDMCAVYNGLDVATSSSSGEGLSNIIGESMACGVPCVVTDVGDSAWVVGNTGEVVPPKDSVALKNAIERLLDQKAYTSDQIRQEIVNRLSTNNLVADTEHTLDALVTGSLSSVRPLKAFRRRRYNT